MRRGFTEEACRVLGINRRDLVEKDLLLHGLLFDLSKNKFFRKNFLFKGGTCLIKHYLGYYRFSEDIDFTWKNQEVFKEKSGKEIRRHLSGIIDELGKVFEEIAKSRGLDFKCDKANRRYVELVGGSKTLTFKIWYKSDVLDRESFTKVQVNFVEELCFNPRKGEIRSLLSSAVKDTGELEFLYPELYIEYSTPVTLNLYDIREILCEKVRSILTRRGIKARDFVDVYLIMQKEKIDLEEMEEAIIQKTRFMLELYKRFRDNFSEKMEILDSGEFFNWGDEKRLLLFDLNEEDFYRFVDEFTKFLTKIGTKIEL
ncbi:MAG: nucleotidyl transferase AbiEii/AbiGii toxin family protein [Candidatus Zixiibacteriota bacterium]